MIVVAIKEFRNKENEKELFKVGTLIDCKDSLAKERIDKKLCIQILNPEILKPKTKTKKNNGVVE